MTSILHQIPRFIGISATGVLVSIPLAFAETTPKAENVAADQLWQSFLTNYSTFSLHPLDPQTLDEKARVVLIQAAGPKFRSWKADTQPSLPALAAAMVDHDPSISKFTRIERTLDALLPQIDIYGHYKSASDVSLLREALRQNPGSVHMTLDQSPDGRILCFPMEDGPAELAGIKAGAILLAVDGRSAEGKSISAIRLAFVGPPNTPIQLKLRQPQGKIEEFTVTRTDKRSPKIYLTKSPLGLTLRIRSFDEGSASLVKRELEPYPEPSRLTIDLRGNPGGLRDEALKVASLFFPQGTPLGKFITNRDTGTANDGNGISVNPATIRILQDGRTASAAEFLIAALKEGLPDKVSLYGSKTYGKGHSTSHITLDGGGELAVTEALLSTASGKTWEKSGITPDTADRSVASTASTEKEMLKSPDEVVLDFLAWYLPVSFKDGSRVIMDKRMDAYIESNTLAAWRKEEQSEHGYGAVPFVGQDYDEAWAKNFKVTKVESGSDKVSVTVRYSAPNWSINIRISLTKTPEGWKIDDYAPID